MKKSILSILIFITGYCAMAQRVPNEMENIDYLMTFGAQAPSSTGDDDHTQIFFIAIPYSQKNPFFIRVYDPDTGGDHDEIVGAANTKTRFSVFGGVGSYSNKDARGVNPTGNFKSGNLLASKIFGNESQYDSKWYVFGPFNPLEGENVEFVKGRVFKLVIEGLTGDDGNAYRFFISADMDRNIPVNGGNAFAYEYTFKLHSSKGTSHLYPFVDKAVISVKQHNFDWDNDGELILYSIARNRHAVSMSGNNEWASSTHKLMDEEKNTTIDFQLVRNKFSENTVSVYFLNQYDEAIPFFAVPIGGPPKYKYDIKVSVKSMNK